MRDAGLIPPGIRAAMSAAWDIREVPAGSVSVHRLRHCIVVGEGLVLDGDMRVLGPTLSAYEPPRVADAVAEVRRAVAEGAVPRLAGTTMLCIKRGAENYGHWLSEMLPRAFVGLPWAEQWRFLVPRALELVARDSLALLGVPAGRVALHGGEPLLCDEVLVVQGLGHHGVSMFPVVADCLRRVAADVPPAGIERVWVSRTGVARALWNEREVEAVLSAAGWHVARPAAMGFREQVALFKGARHIAGVAGAGLANLGFAQPGAAVTCFMPAEMPDTFFWLLSGLCGVRYAEVRCPQAYQAIGIAPWDAHLVLSLPTVLRHLQEDQP